MLILLAHRDANGLRVDSFRYFLDVDALTQFIKDHPKGLNNYPEHLTIPYWTGWHAYRVYTDGTECKPFTLNEYRAIGMRPPRV